MPANAECADQDHRPDGIGCGLFELSRAHRLARLFGGSGDGWLDGHGVEGLGEVILAGAASQRPIVALPAGAGLRRLQIGAGHIGIGNECVDFIAHGNYLSCANAKFVR